MYSIRLFFLLDVRGVSDSDKSYNERTKPRIYRVNENNLGEDLAGVIPIPLKLADRDMQWSQDEPGLSVAICTQFGRSAALSFSILVAKGASPDFCTARWPLRC
jgi:hypothetical protein